MGRPPSPAQRAVQITFVLKGHLKNVQVAYIRVAALLAKVRDDKLYRALGHDWIREFHRPWLARRPKGFIPELTDAQALMWIEHRLADPHLSDGLRSELEPLRAKALAGRLTLREFQDARRQGHEATPPLRAVLRTLRIARRRLAGIPGLPAKPLETLDALIEEIEAAVATTQRIARLAGLPRLREART